MPSSPALNPTLRAYALDLGYKLKEPYFTVDKTYNHIHIEHPITGLTAVMSSGRKQDSSHHKLKDYKQMLRECARTDGEPRFRGGKKPAGTIEADHIRPATPPLKKKSKKELKLEKRMKKADKFGKF